MKVTVNRAELLPLVESADSIAPPQASIAALRGVLLEASEDGKLVVSANNMLVALERSVHTTVDEPGRLVINAHLLTSMLRLLGGEYVTLTGQDGARVEIISENACYTVPAIPSNEFQRMEIPFPEDTVAVTGIPAMARRTVFAASEDNGASILQCINLVFTGEELKAVGCDGNRLAAAKGSSKGGASISLLIPADALGKLARLVTNKDELYVGTTGNSIVFTKENFVFSARLREGHFVDATQMMNSVHPNFTVLTDAAELWSAASSVTTVAGKSSQFSLLFEPSRIRLRCESEMGTSSRDLETVALAGTPAGEYWYNHQQLLGCLKALSGTLILEVGQNGVLLMRTDDLTCLQIAKRKPTGRGKKEMAAKAA